MNKYIVITIIINIIIIIIIIITIMMMMMQLYTAAYGHTQLYIAIHSYTRSPQPLNDLESLRKLWYKNSGKRATHSQNILTKHACMSL